MTPLQVVAWVSAAVCVVAAGWRTWRLAKAPLHLRWELYPIPHEAGRAEYGGSYMEELDWWTKERPHDNLGMIKYMVAEIFLQKAVYESNRPLWLWTFLMHTGLYLTTAAGGLVVVGGVVGAVWRDVFVAGAWLGVLWLRLLAVLLAVGGVLGAVGAVGLLIRRSTDAGMALFTTFEQRLNLLWIAAVSLVGLGVVVLVPEGVGQLRQFVQGMVAPQSVALSLSPVVVAYLLIGALFAAYLPFTHMIHFMSKYFAYHEVRWGDIPNLRGGRIEQQIKEQLAYKPTWSAPHVGADGQRSWLDLAVSKVPADEKTDLDN